MGFDCCAITVIGLKITNSDLYETVEITHGINHDTCMHLDKKIHQFCPDCGQQTVIHESNTEPKSFLTLDNYGLPIIIGQYGFNYEIKDFSNYDDTSSTKSDRYVILKEFMKDGPRSYESDNIVKMYESLEHLIILRNQMKRELEYTGLWNDKNFGIFTLIQFSY